LAYSQYSGWQAGLAQKQICFFGCQVRVIILSPPGAFSRRLLLLLRLWFGSQVEYFGRFTFSDGFDGGEQGGDCFSDTGRGLDKELHSTNNGTVNVYGQFSLPFPVGRKRKLKRLDGKVPRLLPLG
jgi:hypothetical protein